MEWLWAWGGECFGYRKDNRLFAYHGFQAGRFYGSDIYGANGQYLGEIRNEHRLVRCIEKKVLMQVPFVSIQDSGIYTRLPNYPGYVMFAGYEDFPAADLFKLDMYKNVSENV